MSSTVEEDVDQTVREVATDVLEDRRKSNYRFDITAPDSVREDLRTLTYLGRWQNRSDYETTQFEGLVARLPDEVQLIMQSRGYFNSSSQVRRIDNGVNLKVNGGARTTVNQVDLKLVGSVTGLKRVREFALSRWTLPEGSFFESSLWQQSKRDLVEALNQQGYLRARIVSSQAKIIPKLTAASLTIEVDSGPRIAFGDVQVNGLERYEEQIVQDLRPFRPGQPYTLDALLLYQARLRGSGYFSEVSVLPMLEQLEKDPQAKQVAIAVNLTELQTKRAVFGIGYSTDEGPRGQLGLEHRDLFGLDWQMESALILSPKRQRTFANIRTPYDENNYYIGFGGSLEREDIEGQVTTGTNTYIGIGRRVGGIETFLSLQYQIERQLIETTNERSSQRALVLGYTWNLRRLDSTVNPTRGYSVSAQVSGARSGLLTDRSFTRFYGRALRFFPMPEDSRLRNGSLILLGEYGIVRTRDATEIPTENLFRTGGASTIRGYPFLSLGVPVAGATIGGRFLALASVEYQHRMSDLYSLAAFFDYGNASDSAADYDPVAGYGVGVRFRTPVGPINLDIAYGRDLGKWRGHFSVGYTF